jgi:hypothetical protein
MSGTSTREPRPCPPTAWSCKTDPSRPPRPGSGRGRAGGALEFCLPVTAICRRMSRCARYRVIF